MRSYCAILRDGRAVEGHAQNQSDFLDALQVEGIGRHEVARIMDQGRYVEKYPSRGRAFVGMEFFGLKPSLKNPLR